MTIAAAPDVMTIPEAASILRVNPSTLYRATREGSFPSVKVRGKVVVTKSALIAYLAPKKEDGHS